MTDALDFIETALAELPARPADVLTAETAPLLLAAHEGLTRISERHRRAAAELWEQATAVETVAELHEVAAAAERHRQADRRLRTAQDRLQTYLAAAFADGANERHGADEGDTR